MPESLSRAMNDATITCRTCGMAFEWNSASQVYYRDHGLFARRHCPGCRAKRRAALTRSRPGKTFAARATSFTPAPAARKRPVMRWRYVARWVAPALTLTAGLAVGINWLVGPAPALAWLIAINTFALAFFAYDKAAALSERPRVPEAVLLSLTALGGVLGAFMAMWALQHKTSKGSFQIKFWLLASIPLLLSLLLVLLRP